LATKICVSIAETNSSSIRKQTDKAFELGADYVEVRFDFIKPDELSTAIESTKDIKDKSVFTLRSKAEGGKFAGNEEQRLFWLRNLIEQRPMLVDIELETIKRDDNLADFIDQQNTPILVSWHDFVQTPTNDKIAEVLSDMRMYSNYVKVVTTAKNIEDSLRLLDMYESTIGLHPILFAMGDAGIISRVMCTIIGNAPFTYASLGKAIAPGQITLTQMRRLYDKIQHK
jgi:3-dehydroquinate dehydratase I